jgi:hypothetical protein
MYVFLLFQSTVHVVLSVIRPIHSINVVLSVIGPIHLTEPILRWVGETVAGTNLHIP